MSAIQVKSSIVYEAIVATDPDADEIVSGWFQEANPEIIWLSVDLTKPREQGLWFVRHPEGNIFLVDSDDFADDFEEHDPIRDFTAILGSVPTAEVAETPAARKDEQQRINAAVAAKISTLRAAFDLQLEELEEDSPERVGVQLARDRAFVVLGIEDAPTE